MKVQVKEGQQGFIYDKLRNEGDVFNLKPVTCKQKKDSERKPLVVEAESQFSETWMIDLEPKDESSSEKSPSQLTVHELRTALNKEDVDFPEDALKADLLVLYKSL